MRGGWAAHAAVYNAYCWDDGIYATEDLWFFHDGGGNWACIRFIGENRAVLFGQDHEYSRTYFRESARDFGEAETDLLKGAPSWWELALEPSPYGPYISFIYGWDGEKWLRASYDIEDGFSQVGLLYMIRVTGRNSISDAVDHFKRDRLDELGAKESYRAVVNVDKKRVQALVDADGDITGEMLEPLMRGYDIQAGVAAAKKFLLVELA